MDPARFDTLARTLGGPTSRRAALGAAAAGGLLSALGLTPALPKARAAQSGTCRLAVVAAVRLGPSAGVVLAGTTPGELRGDLTFELDNGGAITDGRLRLADGRELPIVGQVLGRALHLRVAYEARQSLVLVGTAEEELGHCRGAVDGLLTGPQPGDLGDWHATATALEQGGSGSSSGSSGGNGNENDRTSGRSGRRSRGTATPTPPGAASTGPTPVPTDCPLGETECDGECVNLMTDPDHCGACQNPCLADVCVDGYCGKRGNCPPGQVECGGECVDLQAGILTCPAGQTDCVCACVDLRTSPNNCGQCNNVCNPGHVCEGGICTCPAGTTICAGACVDLQTDPAHCGDCNTACATGGCVGGACQAAACVADGFPCTADPCCNGQPCDPAGFCGTCSAGPGAPCTRDAECCGDGGNVAMCCFDDVSQTTRCTDVTNIGLVCPCGQGLTNCGGQCVDLATDPDNCRECGNACRGDQICSAAACACPPGTAECEGVCLGCPPGLTMCGGCVCSDLQNELVNCGTCGVSCPAGDVCQGGVCLTPTCPEGLTLCSDQCVDISSHPRFCGGCDGGCFGDDTCENGQCVCSGLFC